MLYNRAPELRELFIKTLNCVTNGYMTHTPLKMIQSFNLGMFSSVAGNGRL